MKKPVLWLDVKPGREITCKIFCRFSFKKSVNVRKMQKTENKQPPPQHMHHLNQSTASAYMPQHSRTE